MPFVRAMVAEWVVGSPTQLRGLRFVAHRDPNGTMGSSCGGVRKPILSFGSS